MVIDMLQGTLAMERRWSSGHSGDAVWPHLRIRRMHLQLVPHSRNTRTLSSRNGEAFTPSFARRPRPSSSTLLSVRAIIMWFLYAHGRGGCLGNRRRATLGDPTSQCTVP